MWLRGPELRRSPRSPIGPATAGQEDEGRRPGHETETAAGVPTVCTRRCVSPPGAQPVGRAIRAYNAGRRHGAGIASPPRTRSGSTDDATTGTRGRTTPRGSPSFKKKRPPQFG